MTGLTVSLGRYSQRYPETLPFDFSHLESSFAAASEKLIQQGEFERLQNIQKEKEAAARAEEDERRAIEQIKIAEERREKDPKTWADRACSSYGLINRSKDLIKQEKEGAKYSGVVNQATLHGAGQTIAFLEKQLSQQKAEYRKYGGKEWTPKDCK
jgi:hypothetical protein